MSKAIKTEAAKGKWIYIVYHLNWVEMRNANGVKKIAAHQHWWAEMAEGRSKHEWEIDANANIDVAVLSSFYFTIKRQLPLRFASCVNSRETRLSLNDGEIIESVRNRLSLNLIPNRRNDSTTSWEALNHWLRSFPWTSAGISMNIAELFLPTFSIDFPSCNWNKLRCYFSFPINYLIDEHGVLVFVHLHVRCSHFFSFCVQFWHFSSWRDGLTFQRWQCFDFTALLVDVEARTHLPAILFDERPGEIFCDAGRWWWSIVVNRWRWGRCGDRDARWWLERNNIRKLENAKC